MKRPTFRMSRRRATIVVVLGVIVALFAAIVAVGAVKQGLGGGASRQGSSTSADRLGPSAQPGTPSSGEGGTGGKATAPGSVDFSAVVLPGGHDRFLVRNGQLTMIVKRGSLQGAVNQIIAITQGYSGYVLSSAFGTGQPIPPVPVESSGVKTGVSSDQSPTYVQDGQAYAWLTVRIPVDSFDQAIIRMQQLGQVQQLTTSAEDVSGQIVDLRARLAHYRAVLARLLTFLDKATSVGSALAVQDRIDQTQLTVDELTAQLKQLEETVSYSTLTVSLSEKAPKPVATAHTNGFWNALKQSGHLIVVGTQGIIVAFGAAVPFLALAVVIAVIVIFVLRAVRRRRFACLDRSPVAVR
jgi:hypothetical protein